MPNEDYIKHIEIEICSQLYEKWKSEKSWYKHVPRKGIMFDIEYIDTRPDTNEDEDIPTILCLHGAPGSHKDFSILRSHLKDYNLRIICPNFPTYKLTKTDKFGHFPEEKVEYILDFLRAINVKRLDMIVSHSSAVYPCMLLFDSELSPTIKSLILLNPCGHRRIKAMKYPFIFSTSAYFYQYKFFRFFIKTFGKPILFVTGCPVKVKEMDTVFLSLTTVTHSHYKKLAPSLSKLQDSGVSTLLIFSENDKLIQKEIFYDMSRLIGINPENLEIYDNNGVQQKSSIDSDYPRGIALQDGGHYAFLTHSSTVNNAIEQVVKDILINNNQKVKLSC